MKKHNQSFSGEDGRFFSKIHSYKTPALHLILKHAVLSLFKYKPFENLFENLSNKTICIAVVSSRNNPG